MRNNADSMSFGEVEKDPMTDRKFQIVYAESTRGLRRSFSLNDDDGLRIGYLDDTATASTSLSTAASDMRKSPLRSMMLFQNSDQLQHDWFRDRMPKQKQRHQYSRIYEGDFEEFRWLLSQKKTEQNFGSFSNLEYDNRYQWNGGKFDKSPIEHHQQSLNTTPSTLSSILMNRRVSNLDNSRITTKNTMLLQMLLSLILIFFLLITILLVVIIFVSTWMLKTTTTPNTLSRWRNCSLNSTSSLYGQKISQNLQEQNEVSQRLISSFNPGNIKENIRWLSDKLHVAGTKENAEIAMKIADKYRKYGYDVRTYTYNVLLNYPNYEKPNRIELDLGAGKWKELSNGLAEKLGPKEAQEQQDDPRVRVYWTAYSKNGTATGPVVYVNYGTIEDYLSLDKHGISLKDKIALCRYGALFRGDKVQLAAQHGAIGVILYSDPFDYANGGNNEKLFPHDIWLPGSGAQRGTLLKTDGDPETPFLPSKYYAYRTETEDSLRQRQVIPSIPVMPIGYRDAQKIMQNLNGIKVKLHDWIGSMNVTYRINGSTKFRLTVHSTCTHRTITNIIATMIGRDEPDRYVLFSNHYDAWTKGAIDPNSATGTMLEMARVLSRTKTITNWRPRRTIMFCQWDGEEFGLIGSTEWVEEFMKPLQQRAVAVINVDNINGNTTLSVKAVPMLYRSIVNAAAKIRSPSKLEREAKRKTLLDSWRFYDPKGPIPGDRSIPGIGVPGSGSDFQRFITYLGIPVIDLKLESAPLYTYMLYHTMYEIPWLLDNLIDENYAAMTVVGQIWLELGRDIADSLIIPFEVHDYGLALTEFIIKMEQQLEHIGISEAFGFRSYQLVFNNLKGALARFQIVADMIQEIIQSINTGHESVSVKQAEMLNTRLQYIERAFIAEHGIYPERAEFRHLIFTSSIHNDYGNTLFAGILDPAINWRNAMLSGNLNRTNYWLDMVKIGLSKLQYAIDSATLILNLDGYYD